MTIIESRVITGILPPGEFSPASPLNPNDGQNSTIVQEYLDLKHSNSSGKGGRIFDTPPIYLREASQKFYRPQPEKFVHLHLAEFLVRHYMRTMRAHDDNRLWFAVAGPGRGNELKVGQRAIGSRSDQFGVVGFDRLEYVLDNIKERASKEGWLTPLVLADLFNPIVGIFEDLEDQHQKNKVMLWSISSVLHEAGDDYTRILENVAPTLCDGGGILIREYDSPPPGTARVVLKSPDARRFFAHFIKHCTFKTGEILFSSNDPQRWETLKGSNDISDNALDMSTRLAVEFRLHLRTFLKVLDVHHDLEEVYEQFANWPELKEHYCLPDEPTDTGGVSVIAQAISKKIPHPPTHQIIPYAISVKDTVDDEILAQHVKILRQEDEVFVPSPLNETRRMLVFLHYVPLGREREFPLPWASEAQMKQLYSQLEHFAFRGEAPKDQELVFVEKLKRCMRVVINADTTLIDVDSARLQDWVVKALHTKYLHSNPPPETGNYVQSLATIADLEPLAHYEFIDKPWKLYQLIAESSSPEDRQAAVSFTRDAALPLTLFAKHGVDVHLISQFPYYWIEEIRRRLQKELKVYVNAIHSLEDSLKKNLLPNPELVEIAMKNASPELTFLIGSTSHDIGAAQSMGILPVLIRRHPNGDQLPTGEYLAVTSLEELVDYLDLR